MISLMIRITRQIRKDHRSLALILLAPLLLLGLLYLLLGDPVYRPSITVAGLPAPLIQALNQQDLDLTEIASATDTQTIDKLLADGQTDAVLSFDASKGLTIRMLEADGTKSGEIIKALRAAMTTLAPQSNMTLTTIYGDPEANMFNSMGYVFLGVLSFFFVYIIAGISFVRERTTGTLERLLMTPIRRWQIVGGYILGFGIFSSLQGILIILFSHYVLGMTYVGPLLAAMLVMVLLSLTAVALGALISSFADNEFQIMQTIPIVIVPQIFFSGLIPIDTLPLGLGNLSVIMPVYYGCQGLKKIMVHGENMSGILYQVAALLVFIILLFALNTLALKKYRRT